VSSGDSERKEREVRVLRGREAGEKYKTLTFLSFFNALEYFQKQDPKMGFELRPPRKRKFPLGLEKECSFCLRIAQLQD